MSKSATRGLTAAMGVSELADASQRSGHADSNGAVRLLTPLFKMHGTERARVSATEAMEVRGGNGFIEDWPEPRLLRDVYVHAIWEGAGNVIALDVLRAIEHGALPGYLADTERHAEAAAGSGPASPLSAPILQALERVRHDLGALQAAGPEERQLPIRRLARRMAMIAIAARLAEQGNAFAADTGSGRLAWLAARYTARLVGDGAAAALADDTAWLAHAGAVLHGGPVPVELAADAARSLAGRATSATPVSL